MPSFQKMHMRVQSELGVQFCLPGLRHGRPGLRLWRTCSFEMVPALERELHGNCVNERAKVVRRDNRKIVRNTNTDIRAAQIISKSGADDLLIKSPV